MSELETAFVGLIILLGAGAILYAGTVTPKGRAPASDKDAAPVMDGVQAGAGRPDAPASGGNGGGA